MRLSRSVVCCLVFVVFTLGIMPGILNAEEFKIAILQDDQSSVQKYDHSLHTWPKRGSR